MLARQRDVAYEQVGFPYVEQGGNMSDVILEERRLVAASATGVLDEYNHEFEFKDSGEFAVIYGPNGVGKTRLLEIIDALCNVSLPQLTLIPFASATLRFSDRTEFSVSKVASSSPLVELRDDESENVASPVADLLFRIHFPQFNRLIESHVNARSNFQVWLTENSTWSLLDGSIWIDRTDGELMQYEDLRRRFGPAFRANNRSRERRQSGELDPIIVAFAESLNVRLIETQRLVVLDAPDQRRLPNYGYEETSRSVPTIFRYSEQIKRSLDQNLSANSRLTQRLDSTFPRRMLDRGDRSVLTETELRAKWEEQTTRRARLTQIADLGVDEELSLPEGELNPWQLGMLELYLADADEKLDSFSAVLARIDLLEDIVNARLLQKKLQIDATNGIVVSRDRDRSSIPLTALSSGEQHEIILMFDLLFNVEAGSIVMIDEPEISLHIGWQKKFIADVLRVSALVGFQFVVATHSPQIIDRWWSRATRLGPTSNEFMGDEAAADDA
jgi:predicted ATP-binding protein involved in virulence